MLYLVNVTAVMAVGEEIKRRCQDKDAKYFDDHHFRVFGFEQMCYDIEHKRWHDLWRTHSRQLLETVMEYYVDIENYERAAEIKFEFDDFDWKQRLSMAYDYYKCKKRKKFKDCEEIKRVMNKYWPFEVV